VEAGCPTANGNGVRYRVICGECGFECGEFGTEAEVGGAQNSGDGADFRFGDVGSAERDVS